MSPRFGLHHIRIWELRRAAEIIESAIQREAEPLKQDLESLSGGLPEDVFEEYAETKAELWQVEKELGQQLRRAVFVSGYSMLEHELESYCVSQEPVGGLKVTEVSGKGIERAQLYIKKVLRRPFPDTSTEWARVKAFNRIRNAIVHRDGRISDDERRKSWPELIGFDLSSGEITLQENWIVTFATTAADFLDEVFAR